MLKFRLLGALVATATLAGCWSAKQRAVAGSERSQLVLNYALRQCFSDHGIDPDAIRACITNAPDEASARSCIINFVGSDEKLEAGKRCVLEVQAGVKIAPHPPNCYHTPYFTPPLFFLFGGVSCTSN
jgi:hypothetical protein